MVTAIKHPVSDRVKSLFVIFDIWTLWHSGLERQSARVSKITITNYDCESKKFPLLFSDNFFQTVGNFWSIFTHLLCVLSTLNDKFLFNYFQLLQSYAILIVTTQRIFYISLER